MGVLHYGSMIQVQFEDRVLAHLQVIVSAKLRRNEPFFFSWSDTPEQGSGRGSLWIDAAVPIYFQYNGSRAPSLNKEWLEQMAVSAGSNQGLVLTEEPRDTSPDAAESH